MWKRMLKPGLLGGVTLMVWAFVANGILGFNSRIRMKRLADERAVYAALERYVTVPGGYAVNPEAAAGGVFPAGEPVFSVQYSGFGHEAAGRLVFFELAIAFLSAFLVAGLLSMASDRVRSSFARRLAFVTGIGVFAAVSGELTRYGIGGYPAGAALLLAANVVVAWTLAGLVMAWSMPPAGPAKS